MSKLARRAAVLVVGGLIAVAGLIWLSLVVLGSQGRARDDLIARFAERATVAAQLIAGSTQVSSARQAADAQVRLSGDPTEDALDAWEGEADPGIPYTALFDRRGRLLAVHPSDADPASEESGRRALRLATRGHPSTSGAVSTAEGQVIEAYVPFPSEDGLRVLVIGQPLELVAQFASSGLEDAAGVPGGAGYVTDRSGTLVAAVGEGAQQRAPQVSEAVSRGRTSGSIEDHSLVVRRVEGTGLVVALTAPEEELTAPLPSTVPPRLALVGFALALVGVMWLSARTLRDARRLEAANAAANEARRMAHQANVAKSEFLSRMSHELRTPLNAVLGFGQLLELEDLAPEQRDSVSQIIKGGRRLLELIDEVLDISRIESGTLRLSLEPVHLESVLGDTIDLIRPLADARAIVLRTDLPADVGSFYVTADQQRFGQVLLNLLSNAVKYNVDGGMVTITALRRDEDRVRIGVTDTGPGIPADKIPLLFAPFERLGAEQSSVEGTGLGLTLSKNLVEAMGGSLDVDAMMGSGTTFWVELSSAEVPAPSAQREPEREPSASTEVGGKILYIEDNLSNLKLIERLVSRRSGIEVIPAMTGALGTDLALQHSPDLILLDLHLPDMRGEEVLIRLNKDPRTRSIPVAILSADATPGQIQRLRASGADAYLTKPINVVEFFALIDRVLGSVTGEDE